jgi:hypothetical protein
MMDMESSEDIRKAIRLLLEAQKLHQIRALTSGTAVEIILGLSPHERAALTREKLAPQIAEARLQAENVVAKASVRLEQVLSSDKNFLQDLHIYASQKLRD